LQDKSSTMPKWLQERRRQWAELRALANQFAEKAKEAFGKVSVWLYGSVARGDFNFWSDVDVLLVAEDLPKHPLERLGLLLKLTPPGVEPIGYTKAEFEALLVRRHPNLLALLKEAVCLRDDLDLTKLVEEVRKDEGQGGRIWAVGEGNIR